MTLDEAIQQEPCEDAISREDAINMMIKNWHDLDGDDAMQLSIDKLRRFPAVQPTKTQSEDAISRDEAIRIASGYCHWSNIPEELKKLPSVQLARSKGKWIPVSERLPEDRREVLVTAYWHETYQVMMASYYGDGLWWCVPFNNLGKHMQKLSPKAWMPLPKPYKADMGGEAE